MKQQKNEDVVIGAIFGLSQKTRVIAYRGWFLMTRATIHASSDFNDFMDYRPIERSIIMINGDMTQGVGVGDVELKMSTEKWSMFRKKENVKFNTVGTLRYGMY
ncbi:hypothetical protein E3N88_05044 [Mikania micrantha]|uniref:Uncharacterized protein n=1 Tax=Mikania micrantha TaxID=192012 RepID=A0A5N6PY03_9ASTR|nr:hypothetical protein E3N88_05044 [Mikania micrantha]